MTMPTRTNRIQTQLIIVTTALFFTHPAAQADNNGLGLYEGQWTGFYQPDGGEREKAKFLVKESRSESDEKSGLSLTIQLDYSPKEDWRFKAQDLETDSDSIKFQFGKNSFQLKCDLKKNKELELVGNCKPIDESAGSTASKMTMVPPQSKENSEDQEESQDETEDEVETKVKKSK
jgi:hypothetical protein